MLYCSLPCPESHCPQPHLHHLHHHRALDALQAHNIVVGLHQALHVRCADCFADQVLCGKGKGNTELLQDISEKGFGRKGQEDSGKKGCNNDLSLLRWSTTKEKKDARRRTRDTTIACLPARTATGARAWEAAAARDATGQSVLRVSLLRHTGCKHKHWVRAQTRKQTGVPT